MSQVALPYFFPQLVPHVYLSIDSILLLLISTCPLPMFLLSQFAITQLPVQLPPLNDQRAYVPEQIPFNAGQNMHQLRVKLLLFWSQLHL